MSIERSRSFFEEIERVCGLSIGNEKKDLLENRLFSLMENEKFINFSSLFQESISNPSLMAQVVDLLLTHETSFFRDPKVFSFLDDFFLKNSSRFLRVWSAGCSTGQEVYSISMMLSERKRDFFLLATDISETCLRKAQRGVYTPFDIQRGITPDKIKKFFNPHPEGWELKKGIREKVKFHAHNLIQSPLPEGSFDIILCRNVLLYFKTSLREKILRSLISLLSPGGLLILGASEMSDLSSFSLNPVKYLSGVYKKTIINPS